MMKHFESSTSTIQAISSFIRCRNGWQMVTGNTRKWRQKKTSSKQQKSPRMSSLTFTSTPHSGEQDDFFAFFESIKLVSAIAFEECFSMSLHEIQTDGCKLFSQSN